MAFIVSTIYAVCYLKRSFPFDTLTTKATLHVAEKDLVHQEYATEERGWPPFPRALAYCILLYIKPAYWVRPYDSLTHCILLNRRTKLNGHNDLLVFMYDISTVDNQVILSKLG